MGQKSSSPFMYLNNEFIKFLLAAPRSESKVIATKVNATLYNYVVCRAVELGCSISEYIKLLIIRDMMEHGYKIDINEINKIAAKVNTKKKDENNELYISKKEWTVIENKLNSKRIKREIDELKMVTKQLLNKAKRLSMRTWKYSTEFRQLQNQLEYLRARVLSLRKYKIPRQYIDDIMEIIDIILDIEDLLKT